MDLRDVLFDQERELGAALAGWADMRRDEADRLAEREKIAKVLEVKQAVADPRGLHSRTPGEQEDLNAKVLNFPVDLLESLHKKLTKKAGIERVAEMWKSLPPEAKAAIIGGPIGAAITGAGQYASSRPMMGGESREEITAKSLRDKLQQLNEAQGGGGFSGQTMEGLAEGSARQSEINKEHPLKAALLASLLGAAGGAGTGAMIARLR